MTPAVAIVGMACRYPDARTPGELWENVLAQRRAFRRLPAERLRAADYLSPDLGAPDRTYVAKGAVIEGYEFDRVAFKVAGSTFRSADLAHWLALDVAAQALRDAGFPDGADLPRETSGVLLGNTLTGEFSRANTLRLRWPYVRRVVEAQLAAAGWAPDARQAFLAGLEVQYKAPFPPVGEESLAGSLSNTIAGRICNHFDLKGGGYTVDGACASSLLAVATACTQLAAGELDVVLAGGVDLSLDPLEIVGFAKAGALAPEQMRVYDARSAGFWPGEGCGFVVLMRQDEAVAQGRRIYALIRGWGISSDGSGGLTRPEIEGQLLAVQRAYRRAGFGAETVGYFEGHGTGTAVGDATELQVLTRARGEAAPGAPPAALGTIKGNIGHTKAAAGIAGLIKATLVLHHQILPPTTGCAVPHPILSGPAPALRVLQDGEPWPARQPLRAAVSAMGFGGINAHMVLEGTTPVGADLNPAPAKAFTKREQALLSSYQDAELFLFGAPAIDTLRKQVARVQSFAARLSLAELADLAATLARNLSHQQVRAAVVAATPEELAARLQDLQAQLARGTTRYCDVHGGVFLGGGARLPRLGFLFPGQGSPAHLTGGAWRRRFAEVRELYRWAALPSSGDGVATQVAQPAIVAASLAALAVLDQLDIRAAVGVGHSLGELTALHWGGAMDRATVLRVATARGQAMADLGSATGAMASLRAGREDVQRLINGDQVTIAGLNAPLQTVVSGEAAAIAALVSQALAQGIQALRLPVSHAFHSPLVAAAGPALGRQLGQESVRPVQRPVISTVTGAALRPDEDLRDLLCRQVTAPVRFLEAMRLAAEGLDLWIEVGPGAVLSGLAADIAAVPVVALDAGGPSLRGLLQAVGAAFALGTPVNHSALFAGRFTQPFDLDWRPRFFVNPCELAPLTGEVTSTAYPVTSTEPAASSYQQFVGQSAALDSPQPAEGTQDATRNTPEAAALSPLELIRALVAERAELPATAVKDDSRLLGDLHLNSIAVGKLVTEAARRLGLAALRAPLEFADATVAAVARALEELKQTQGTTQDADSARWPAGVDSWIRAFTVDWVERRLADSPAAQAKTGAGAWQVLAPPDHLLAAALREALAGWAGGVLVCLPPDPDESHLGLLLTAAHAVLAHRDETRFVLVQQACAEHSERSSGAAGLARTLCLEAPWVTTCVVDVPVDEPQAPGWIVAEIQAARGYVEARYDRTGRRWQPVLRLLPLLDDSAALPLGPADVLVVTGGGKGIAAECALALARASQVRLALLGRSQPETDQELAANLQRLAVEGIAFRYLVVDVTDAGAVRDAVQQIEADLGPVTALLHGAGLNAPQLLSVLDEAAFLRTLAPKLQGLRNVLAAVDPDRLRLLVTFGSIIARTGLPGEADYALANEWLARLTARWQEAHAHCRCLTAEWSIWSGVGMGERLGRVEALMQAGITPIPPDEGVRMLRRLLTLPDPPTAIVVSGRFGQPPTLKMEQPELPFLRFLEQPRVYYPGIELIADAEISYDTDPYLRDHLYQGDALLPAVVGLEAMAQAALAVTQATGGCTFEHVEFNRPVVVAAGQALTIRIAALVRESGQVEVVLRSADSGFQVDHFRAVCRIGGAGESLAGRSLPPQPDTAALPPAGETACLPLDPERDLYGNILFHGARFHCVRGYRVLTATECLAELRAADDRDWFGRYLPQELLLGHPGLRDAAIHAVQACIPHGTLLPTGVDRLVSLGRAVPGPWLVHAWEHARDGDTFTYDLDVTGEGGRLIERWVGLRLRRIERKTPRTPWAEPLLSTYVERQVQELIAGSRVAITVQRDASADRSARSDRAARRAWGEGLRITRRADGKPTLLGDQELSASHCDDLTMLVAGPGPLGCDLQAILAQDTAGWRALLGPAGFALAQRIAAEANEGEDVAGTRVWAAHECLKKAGAMLDAPVLLAQITGDRWVLLASGSLTIATVMTTIRGARHPLVLAVLARSRDESL